MHYFNPAPRAERDGRCPCRLKHAFHISTPALRTERDAEISTGWWETGISTPALRTERDYGSAKVTGYSNISTPALRTERDRCRNACFSGQVEFQPPRSVRSATLRPKILPIQWLFQPPRSARSATAARAIFDAHYTFQPPRSARSATRGVGGAICFAKISTPALRTERDFFPARAAR